MRRLVWPSMVTSVKPCAASVYLSASAEPLGDRVADHRHRRRRRSGRPRDRPAVMTGSAPTSAACSSNTPLTVTTPRLAGPSARNRSVPNHTPIVDRQRQRHAQAHEAPGVRASRVVVPHLRLTGIHHVQCGRPRPANFGRTEQVQPRRVATKSSASERWILAACRAWARSIVVEGGVDDAAVLDDGAAARRSCARHRPGRSAAMPRPDRRRAPANDRAVEPPDGQVADRTGRQHAQLALRGPRQPAPPSVAHLERHPRRARGGAVAQLGQQHRLAGLEPQRGAVGRRRAVDAETRRARRRRAAATTGAMPDDRIMLLIGQCATPMPRRARAARPRRRRA